jgi:hypothetical protein
VVSVIEETVMTEGSVLWANHVRVIDAIAENTNSQIQAAIVRDRGFKSLRSLTNIIFLKIE